MTSRPTVPLLTAALLAGLAAEPRGQDFAPVGPEWRVNAATAFSQEWSRVAMDDSGDRIAFVWETGLNSDVKTRAFDGNGNPVTPETLVNAMTSGGNQDEPAITMDRNGNHLVAWSDRAGNDGFQMGIFARLYDDLGVAVDDEFQVNVEWPQSQWEPLMDTLPDGSFVVAWSGRDNGDAFFRIFDPDGVPQTGDIQVNTLVNNAQIDIAPAVAPDGTIFCTWVDFGGAGAGNGTALFGRMYDKNGVPLQPNEYQLHSVFLDGDQKEPRVVADRLGNGYVLVWEDGLADGSGKAIVARRFNSAGAALGDEFIVNQTTLGHQDQPALAMDWVGNWIVAWRDGSTLFSRVMARRYDAAGNPLGDEFVVRDSTVAHVRLPSVAVDDAGEDFVISYTARGPGETNSDVWARQYAFRPIAEATPPAIGTTFELDLHMPGGAGLYYILVGSFGTSPGLPLPEEREFPLVLDVLFDFSLFSPNTAPFSGFQGTLDGDGKAAASLELPFDPGIVGVTLYFAAVSVDLAAIGLEEQLHHVTEAAPFVLQ